MREKLQPLSPTEWSLMKICWAKDKPSAREVYEETLKEKERGYQTVKTMLDRLVGKGWLKRERLGPIWLYIPTVSRTRATSQAIESFAGSVLDNAFGPLIAHLAKGARLTTEETSELRSIVDSQTGSKGDGHGDH